MIYLTDEEKNYIRREYVAGKSMLDLGKELKHGNREIKKFLVEEGVVIRPKFKGRGELSPSWMGGKTKTDKGYITVLLQEDHPRFAMATKARRVMEHRLVMADYLGRDLTSDENVHHINGIKDDNRIENLELWTTMQPSGKRVRDLLEYADAIIERYRR